MRKQLVRLLALATTLPIVPGPVHAGITEVSGVIGKGAAYRFQVPDGMDGDVWNGRVVYYAHGTQSPTSDPFIQPEPFLTDLLALGFAVAQSSYSGSGWAVKEAMVEMHQLRGLFRARFGTPTHAYLLGRSMGGTIVVGMAERYTGQYDGVLAICGNVGGADRVMDQVAHVWLAFDYYYPGVLPDFSDVPDSFGFGEAFGAVWAAVMADPAGALRMAGEPTLYINAASFHELLLNIALRIAIYADGMRDLIIERLHGHEPFDNLGVVYDDPALDAGIERIASHPSAERYIEHYQVPSGHLTVPVLTLHNVRDPIVPIEQETRFAELVDAAGSSALLVQQTVNRFGHCAFTNAEVVGAMVDLVNWAEYDVAPMPGDVTVP